MIPMPLGVDAESVEGLPAGHPRLGMLLAELPHRLEIFQRSVTPQRFKQVPQFRIKSGGFQGIVSPDPIGCCPVAVKHTPQAAHMGGLLELGREQRRDIVLRHIEKRIFFTDHGTCSCLFWGPAPAFGEQAGAPVPDPSPASSSAYPGRPDTAGSVWGHLSGCGPSPTGDSRGG